MNEAEHTFPLPENVAHQLEAVEEELDHQPLRLKVHDYVKANPWQTVGVSVLAGLILGALLRRSR